MYKRTSGLIVAGLLVGGAVGAVAVTPASAITSNNVITSRLAGIKSALSGLVSDGTLTQSQADKVAGTLDSKLPQGGPGGMGGPGGHMGGMGGRMGGMGGPGGHMGGMGMAQTQAAVAKALGMTTDKLEAALEGGKSLADVAKQQKVSVDSLIKVMVTARESQLATAVKEGTLTQAMADRMKASLKERITAHVNGVRPGHGRTDADHGPGGMGWSSPTGANTGGTASTPSSNV